MRLVLIAFVTFACLAATAASAAYAFGRTQASVKSTAHDAKAHSIWQAEQRKRWRHGLKHGARSRFKVRIEVLQ
jgi:predicted porin